MRFVQSIVSGMIVFVIMCTVLVVLGPSPREREQAAKKRMIVVE